MDAKTLQLCPVIRDVDAVTPLLALFDAFAASAATHGAAFGHLMIHDGADELCSYAFRLWCTAGARSIVERESSLPDREWTTIETMIGSAYISVLGLPRPREQPAEAPRTQIDSDQLWSPAHPHTEVTP